MDWHKLEKGREVGFPSAATGFSTPSTGNSFFLSPFLVSASFGVLTIFCQTCHLRLETWTLSSALSLWPQNLHNHRTLRGLVGKTLGKCFLTLVRSNVHHWTDHYGQGTRNVVASPPPTRKNPTKRRGVLSQANKQCPLTDLCQCWISVYFHQNGDVACPTGNTWNTCRWPSIPPFQLRCSDWGKLLLILLPFTHPGGSTVLKHVGLVRLPKLFIRTQQWTWSEAGA